MAARPTIRRDRSTTTILVHCSDCPPWHSLCGDAAEADEAAADHLVRCHGVAESEARAPAVERARRARLAVRS